jgi:hypothetical protein
MFNVCILFTILAAISTASPVGDSALAPEEFSTAIPINGTATSTSEITTISTTHPRFRGIPPTPISNDSDLDDLAFDYPTCHDELTDDNSTLRVHQDCDNGAPLCDPETKLAKDSPFAECKAGFEPVWADKSKVHYTICCNTSYTGSTVYDKSGFGCCKDRSQIYCNVSEDIVKCLTNDLDGKEHKVEEEEVGGVKVCKGDAERSLKLVLIGLGWMGVLWAGCIGFFWAL